MVTKLCSMPACDRVFYARTWCAMHYQRWLVHGDVHYAHPTYEDRMRRRFTETDGCWLWQGEINPDGYGKFDKALAHRASYEHFVGSIPEGLTIDHLCHTNDLSCEGGPTCLHRRCVRPDHLEPITAEENVKRGRPANRTHCRHGHAWTDENTYRCKGTGARICRACGRAHKRRKLAA